MKDFKGIEKYELVSLDCSKCVFNDDDNFVNLDICFRITRERGNLIPLFFDNDFNQFMESPTETMMQELIQPFMDEHGVDIYIMLPDQCSIKTKFNKEKNEYTVYVFPVFEFTFKDKRALHLFKLKHGGAV